MAKGTRFVYRGRKRTAESVTRRAQAAGRTFDSYLEGVPLLKVKEGENVVRILPATWADEEAWGDNWDITVHLHYNVGADKGTYLCLAKMKDEDCPVCMARGEATDEDEQAALRVSERHLAWVIDRDNEKAGPQIWSMPSTLFKEVMNRSVDKKSRDVLYLDDPEEGYDITFTREGTALRTKYSGVEVSRDPSPLTDNDKVFNRWLDYINDNPLPELLNYYDAEYIEKVLFGQVARSAETEDATEPPSRTSRTRRQAEAEETEPPRRAARIGKPTRTVEPESEEETEPEADPEEVEPRTTRRPIRSRSRNGGETEEPEGTQEELELEPEPEEGDVVEDRRPRRTTERLGRLRRPAERG